jgi:type IV/VI secretion system ImpK/VasF family protein
MKLLTFCEPILLEVCKLNRLQRVARMAGAPNPGQRLDFYTVQNNFLALFKKLDQEVVKDRRLSGLYGSVRAALVFFVDEYVMNSPYEFKAQWGATPLQMAMGFGSTGYQKFFQDLDAQLQQGSEDSRERLVVYYCCLGLGFRGVFSSNVNEITTRMDAIKAELGDWIDGQTVGNICPDAYYADTKVLWRKPSRWTKLIVILFLILLAGVLAFYVQAFWSSIADLYHQLKT